MSAAQIKGMLISLLVTAVLVAGMLDKLAGAILGVVAIAIYALSFAWTTYEISRDRKATARGRAVGRTPL